MAQLLIVEDDPVFTRLLVKLLTQAGHHTTAAADGHEALACLARHPYDLVLTDILMPGMDGIDLIGELRRRQPALPILAMSGGRRSLSSQFNLESATLMGAAAILPKPFEQATLLEAVTLALEHKTGTGKPGARP